MRSAVCVLVLLLAAGLMFGPGPAPADQTDPRLESLFGGLKTAAPSEAEVIERRIWAIWSTYDGKDEATRMAFQRGLSAMGARRNEAAIDAFTEVVEAAPDFAEGWNKRATVRWLAGDFDGSVADIRRTLALEPRHFGALSGLGLILMQTGEHDAAIRAFEEALAVNPHMTAARAHLEALLERQDDQRI